MTDSIRQRVGAGGHWGNRPFLGQITDAVYRDRDGRKLGYAHRYSWYVPTTSDPDNRILFGPGCDRLGAPRMDIRFRQDDPKSDLDAARDLMARIADKMGRHDSGRDAELLAPGMSLHFTGTTRAGNDPEISVTDTDGRVWGFDNLLLAGGSVIPTAMAGNTTLPAVVTAVRAGRAVAHALN